MKKSFISISLMSLFFATTLNAQDSVTVAKSNPSFHVVEFGLRLMPTFSSVSMESSAGGKIKGEATLGFGFGGFLGFNFTNHVGFNAALLYNSVTQKYIDEGLDREMKIRYVTIPLLLSVNTGVSNPVNLKVEFGPQIGVNVGSDVSVHGDTLQTVLLTKQTGIGLAYGAGFGFTLNPERTIRLDIGYLGAYGKYINTNSAYLGVTFRF